MPTPRDHADLIPPWWRHFLVDGCWRLPDAEGHAQLDPFLTYGHILRHDLEDLQKAWDLYGDAVKRDHPEPVWAERVLGGEAHGPGECDEHPRSTYHVRRDLIEEEGP